MENRQTEDLYEFGDFRLDVKKRRLLKGEDIVSLTSKEFEVLLFLIENAGRVVEKDALLDAVWTDVYVEETTLARNVSWLRQKLAAAGGTETKFIETVPKRGYRFAADVMNVSADAELIVEEKTVRRIRIEETAVISESEFGIRDLPNGGKSPAAAERNLEPVERKTHYDFRPQNRQTLRRVIGIAALLIIGFFVYQIYFRQAAPRAVFANRITPFSGAAGLENTPAFSPDGKQIAFSWNGGDGGDTNIYLRNVNAVEPLRLTASDSMEHYPVFAPDGAHIAFIRDFKTHGEVILIPTLGGAERRVARLFSGNYSISFSPNGKELAVIDTEDSSGGKQHRVYLLNIETGERRRAAAGSEFQGETTPRFAPDGERLAFVRMINDKNSDLFVVETTGNREPRQITFDRTTIHSLAWSADGREIFFVSLRGDERTKIWNVAATGGEPQIFLTNSKAVTNIAAAPDGKSLAFVEHAVTTDIWQTTADGATSRKFIASSYSERQLIFAPDEKRVAFTSDRTGKYAIWVAGADGKNLRQLTSPPPNADAPRFAPDGERIVFSAALEDRADIFAVPTEGGSPVRLTFDAASDLLPSYSADGRWIYFISDRSGSNQIWRMPAAGESESAAVQMTRGGAFQVLPAPDGKTIYYTENGELRRVATDGGAEETVPEFTAAGFDGKWTMTRGGIYFIARQNDQPRILFYDFADLKIKDAPAPAIENIPLNSLKGLAATNDGGRFLFELSDQNSSNIMLAEISR